MKRAGAMAQLLRALAALPKDSSNRFISQHLHRVLQQSNSSARAFNALHWYPQVRGMNIEHICVCRQNSHSHTTNKILKRKCVKFSHGEQEQFKTKGCSIESVHSLSAEELATRALSQITKALNTEAIPELPVAVGRHRSYRSGTW